MNRDLSIRNQFDLPSLHKFTVGFDPFFQEIEKLASQKVSVNYPPYNIIKNNEDNFTIELAVAGFRDSEINITVERNVLTVDGSQDQSTLLENVEYLHKGISNRTFNRTFRLADHVEVLSAELENGILKINLERRVPEEQKPRKIDITNNK